MDGTDPLGEISVDNVCRLVAKNARINFVALAAGGMHDGGNDHDLVGSFASCHLRSMIQSLRSLVALALVIEKIAEETQKLELIGMTLQRASNFGLCFLSPALIEEHAPVHPGDLRG